MSFRNALMIGCLALASCGGGSEAAPTTTAAAPTTTAAAPTTTAAAPTTTAAAPTTTAAAPTTTAAAPTTTAGPAGPLGEVEILLEPNGGQETSVSSAGLWTMNVVGASWAGPPIFVLTCTATDLITLVATGIGTCDLVNLRMGMPSDGAFSLSFDLLIPEDGLCIAAGDQAQMESGGACISVD